MSDLINRKDAIKALCKAVHRKDETIPCPNQTVSCLWGKTRVCDFASEIYKVSSPWIPCSDRLPDQDHRTVNDAEYSDHLLITVENQDDGETVVDVGVCVNGKWYSNTLNGFVPNHWEVIAWAEMPNPYKGDV